MAAGETEKERVKSWAADDSTAGELWLHVGRCVTEMAVVYGLNQAIRTKERCRGPRESQLMDRPRSLC